MLAKINDVFRLCKYIPNYFEFLLYESAFFNQNHQFLVKNKTLLILSFDFLILTFN